MDRRSTPSLGLTSGRTDKNLCRCFGAPACRVFPDHLITLKKKKKITLPLAFPQFIAITLPVPQFMMNCEGDIITLECEV